MLGVHRQTAHHHSGGWPTPPIAGTQGLMNKARMAGPDAVQPSELGAGVRVKGLPEQISVVLVVSPWKPTALPLGARSHHGHQGNR